MSGKEPRLRLLEDLPIQSGADYLKYRTYAESLKQVFESVGSGACVGLFGKWGQGKSSVVKMLDENRPDNTKVVVFNAWQSQGDSVRRQMLLSLVESIRPDSAKQMKSFFGLDVKWKPEKKIICPEFSWKQLWADISQDWRVKACIFLSAVFLVAAIVCFYLAFKNPADNSAYIALATSLCIPGIVPFAAFLFSRLGMRYRIEMKGVQQGSDSLRFEYPEQFRDEFAEQVSAYLTDKKNPYKRIIFVVDDLDRCDANTVAEALASVRQFSGANRSVDCQFLIPCDEKQVVLALEAAGHNVGEGGAKCHDYQNEELLRKYFDVVVRMDAAMHQDMVAYAEKLVEEKKTDLSKEEAREIVSLAQAKDPRAVKKILNALVVAQVKRKRSQELLPTDPMELMEETERFLVVLREKAPLAYEALGENPGLLQSKFSVDQKDEGLDEWNVRQYQMAHHLMELQPISIPTALVLLYGRLDNEIRGVQAAGLLAHAIMEDDPEQFRKAMGHVNPDEVIPVRQWVVRKCKELRTVADGRRMLMQLMDYGYTEDSKELEFIGPCLNAMVSAHLNIPKVMEKFGYADELEDILPRIERETSEDILAAMHKAFAEGGYKDDEALQVLLRLASICKPVTRYAMRDWMEKEIGNGDNSVPFASRLVKRMSLDAKSAHIYGAFPGVAKRLSSIHEWWLFGDESDEEAPFVSPIGELIVLFAGDNEEVCNSCLDTILQNIEGPAGPQAFSSNQLDETHALWGTIGKLLGRVRAISEARASKFIKWLQAQSELEIQGILLSALWPSVPRFPETIRGEYIELYFSPYCFGGDGNTEGFSIPQYEKLESDSEYQVLWTEYFKEILVSIYELPQILSRELSGNMRGYFSELAANGWSFPLEADTILSKIISAGNSWEGWFDAIIPLGRKYSETEKAICQNLTSEKNIEGSIQLGMRTIWENRITSSSGNPLGVALVDNFEDDESQELWREVFEHKNADRIIGPAITRLNKQKYDVEWLYEHKELLIFIANELCDSRTDDLIRGFCDILQRLVYEPCSEYVHMAAVIIRHLPAVTPLLHQKLSDTYQENRGEWEDNNQEQWVDDFKAAVAVKMI